LITSSWSNLRDAEGFNLNSEDQRWNSEFKKSKEMPAWRIFGQVNEVNGVNDASSWCFPPPLSDGSTKWPRPAGVLDKVIDKVDPETWTRLALLTPY
jgi:hypothetical protein